jgi:Ca2+-binding RTX toxin-like protein
MSTADPVTSPSSSNTWINGLKWGAHWDSPGSGPTVITYALQSSGTLDFGGTPVTATPPYAEEEAALAAVLASIENIINVDFVLTTNPANADIVYASVDDLDAGGNLGVAVPPGEYFNPAIGDWQGAVIVNYEAYVVDGAGNPAALNPGGFDYITWLHETGHALGLAHPHDNDGTSTIFPGVTAPFNDYGDFDMNQGINTTMTYNDGWVAGAGAHGASTSASYGYQMGLMALDIAALQLMYGANMSYRTGNDNYYVDSTNGIGSGYFCIWDASGIDTIIGTGSQSVRIDLRAATLGLDANGGGYVSSVISGPTIYAGLTIAAGVVIENARGSTGADTLIGNAANNILNGLGGGDAMEGLGGNDTYYTDNVLDSVTEAFNAGIDIVRSTVNWVLSADVEKLYILDSAVSATGNALSNYIYGNNAANTINGLAGADRLYGYLGNDLYIVDSTGDLVYETSATGGIDTVESSVNHTLSANVENLTLTGAANINGTGNTSANTIAGNSNVNFIDGKGGNDTLTGGGGNDQFLFTTAPGAANIDTITDFSVPNDTIRLDDAIFTSLGLGYVSAAAFHIGASAADASDRIIYNSATGAVLYDADGLGGTAAQQFATLAAGLAVTATDFYVF